MVAIQREHVETAQIPAELAALPNWLAFRVVPRTDEKTGERKLDKIPVDGASSTDPATWRTLALAREIIERGRGDVLGFALPADHSITGIDLDHCLDPETGALRAWAVPIVARFRGRTYIERTPSGEGLRIWARGHKGGRCKTLMPEGGAVELYDHKRLFTVTGRAWEDAPATLADMQGEIDALYAELFPPVPQEAATGPRAGLVALDMDDEELLTRARNARDGARFCALFDAGDLSGNGNDHSAADLALCNLLAFWCGPDAERIDRLFRRSALYREKWERPDYAFGRTIDAALAKRTEFYSGPRRRAEPDPEGAGGIANQFDWQSPEDIADVPLGAAELAEMRRRIRQLDAALAERDKTIAALRAQNQALKEANVRMNERIKWVDNVVAQPADRLSPSEKCVTIALRRSYERETWKRDDRGYVEPYMPKLAAAAGVSEATAGKAISRLGGKDAIVKPFDRQERPVMTPKGKRTHVAIAIVPEVIEDPDKWMPAGGPREHGGPRENAGRKPKCPTCGSEDVTQHQAQQIIHRVVTETRCHSCGDITEHVGPEHIVETRSVLQVSDDSPAVVGNHLENQSPDGGEMVDHVALYPSVEASPIGQQVGRQSGAADAIENLPADILRTMTIPGVGPTGPACLVCGAPKRKRPGGGYDLTCQCGARKAAG